MLPVDLILWYWILGLPMNSPPMEKPPVEATQAAFPDAPMIDEFGGRWKLPGFTRVKPLTYKDADPLKGAHPVKMSGDPMGMGLPRFRGHLIWRDDAPGGAHATAEAEVCRRLQG